ncbi:hypothetical protein D1814_15680 [Alteromonas sp. BL110]|uniref:hypothetical protein n=1 Tax=Alteromonas sp. BL110 TaxID=1714845 RepID=UPI000E4991D3|nr:hypothetical protein [Alteromonas sp. BL110]AXT40018.1 hypothetical protein D1814_15680 [Alteromonas sp. BL110]RKM79247.1 hypothetical protein D7031_09675 [Alteromonas sp. BL110]
MRTPDFHKARYSACHENPFRLTPPSAQAKLYVDATVKKNSSASAADESSTQQQYPDPSFSDVFTAFKEAFSQKKEQGFAFLELTNSELMLVKKSFFVTVFACLAAFAVGTVCWLILNIAIGAILHNAGVHYVVVPLVLLVLNSLAAFGFFKLAQNAFNYLSLGRLIQTWRRVFE